MTIHAATTSGPRYLDDLQPGDRFVSRSYSVTEADIVAFAREFDPQPYHLDPEAARRSAFNGLAASGWHTAAIMMRLWVDTRPFGDHPILGLGVDELRWLAPVRPGDVLHATGEVVEVVPSKSKPDRGTVRVRLAVINQDGATVMTLVPIMIVPRRPG